MKYLLLLMTLVQAGVFWNSFKTIFTTDKQDEDKINAIRADMIQEHDIEFITSVLVILIPALMLFTISYYSMISVYVGGFLFAVVSFGLMIVNIKRLWNVSKCLIEIEEYIIVHKSIFWKLFTVAKLLYVAYFTYMLATTW